MSEDFVSFDLAKKLKEKGFREPCGYVYNYKRKELEYKKEYRSRNKYVKRWRLCKLIIRLHKEEIADFYIDINVTIDNQNQIDIIQQAFNQLQNDLEGLKDEN
jgi:hypothetical protein